MTRFRKKFGFTLLELGLVLVVLSLLVGGLLSVTTQNIRLAKKKEVETKMDVIENAVLSYRKAHGFIPCPGDITLVETDENFGFQAVNPGSCEDGTGLALSPSVTFQAHDTVGGMVPVRTLGLPDDYARDPWNGKFLYVVDKRATLASTFSVTKLTDTSTLGSIWVYDGSGSGTPVTTTAVMLLLSHGPNGHGAYTGSTRKFTGSTNTDEQDNCGCNATSTQLFDNVFYAHPPTTSSAGGALNSFDDIVRYYSRSQLYSTTDITTEK